MTEFFKVFFHILAGLGDFLNRNAKDFFNYIADNTNKYIEELTGIAVCASTVHLVAGVPLNILDKAVTGIIGVVCSLLSAYLINKLKPFWNRKRRNKLNR